MKFLSSIAITLLLFTGCANLGLNTNKVKPKQELIEDANNGNTKAILALAKNYNFPKTKEGLYYFNKWYEELLNVKSSENLTEIAKIYEEYNDMFINGKEKTVKLYEKAIELNSKDASVELIKYYTKNYKYEKAKALQEKVIDELSEKQLADLYIFYNDKYKKEQLATIKEFMDKKGYKEPFEVAIKNLRRAAYQNKDSEVNSFINETIDTKDSKKIFLLADKLKRFYKYKESIRAYEAGLKIDNTNAQAYYKIAKMYKSGNYKQKLKADKDEAAKYLEKAALLKHKEAAAELLKYYSEKPELMDKFFAIKSKLEESNEGKLFVARYYDKKRYDQKANAIYNELAKDGNKEAILELATKKPSKYNFNPEEYKLTLKWQDYILKSDDIELKKELEKKLTSSYGYRDYFNETKEKLKDLPTNEKTDILELRKSALYNKYRKPEIAIEYYKKGVAAGDVKSAKNLARFYLSSKQQKYNEAIKVYEDLHKRGDLEATRLLAELYINPPYYLKDFKKEPEKGLAIYEDLASKGNIDSINRLVNLYLCGSCKDSESIVNYKKGFKYSKELLEKRGSARDYANIAWSYHYGKGVDIDLLKAKEYYEEAAKRGYASAYYNLAWLYYKNDDYKGQIIELNYEKAKEYLELGAKERNSASINLLGVFYKKGYAVKKDMEKAVALFKIIYRYDRYASFHLGEYYNEKKDYKEAVKYYKISDERGNAGASIELGVIYEKGLLGKKDVKTALKYYEKAFRNSEDETQKGIAAYNIGIIYQYGKGEIEKDLKKAKAYLEVSTYKKAKTQLKLIK